MRRKRPLEYWLQKLRDTENEYLLICDTRLVGTNDPLYEVSIGDCDTYHDYWQKQPYFVSQHKDLGRAIELALEGYEASKRQFLMDQLK